MLIWGDDIAVSYGLAQHKGYGTPLHLKALRSLGPSPIHRMSFAPCAQVQMTGVASA